MDESSEPGESVEQPTTPAEPVPPPPRPAEMEPIPEPLPEPVFTPFSLTVGDGFKFGCGFTMAVAIASLIGLLIISLFFLAASLAGIPLPGSR